jgi:uncharacterized SAM-binding protein YcdF (DUF218 family)
VTPIDLVKWTGGPGSIQLLLMLTAIGLWLSCRRPRHRVLGRSILGITGLTYWILATPVTARSIERILPSLAWETGAVRQAGIDTLVVLDGDNRRGRLAKALSVWRVTAPTRVIVSGQSWLIDELMAAGVPESRLSREEVAATTREQIAWLRALMSAPSAGHVAVIASRLQAPRVASLIQRAGVPATVVPSAVDTEPWSEGVWALVPSYAALRLSRDALYECAALRYYEIRGWIDRPMASVASDRWHQKPGAAQQARTPRA